MAHTFDLAMGPEPLVNLERMYISIVLNDCLEQLCILSHLQLSYGDSDFSPDEGLNTMQQKDIEELENDRKANDRKEYTLRWQRAVNLTRPNIIRNALIAMVWNKMMSFRKMTKLGRQHKLLELVIAATREEIENKGTFPCLQTVIVEEQERKKKFELIMRLAIDTDKRIFELSRQSHQLTREHRQNVERHNEIIGILTISQKKLKYKASIKLLKEQKLSNVHVEQKLKRLFETYDEIIEEFRHTRDATKKEERMGTDISTLLNKRHVELDGLLEYWMDRYEKRIDETQRKLEVLRNKRRQQWDRTFNIIQLHNSYSSIVAEHKRELLEKELRDNHEKRRITSSIKIQTWWRCTMVRKQLGPFRLKKRGKDKGKGKGKKGKKK